MNKLAEIDKKNTLETTISYKPIDNNTYTYADYLNFTDDEPVGIIDGRISAMSTTPSI